MKRSSILFLKLIILLIASAAIAWIIVFPQLEGRATNLDLIRIYTDPLIIYAYIASIPFFVALYQAFKLLDYVAKNKIFSQAAVKASKSIKFCALALIGFIIVGETWIVLTNNGDDAAGVVAIGIFTTILSLLVAITAALLEKKLGRAK